VRSPKEKGTNVLLDFNKRLGREDEIVYRQSEMHKNIKSDNDRAEKAAFVSPMFRQEHERYLL
jgi:hypothetical protein